MLGGAFRMGEYMSESNYLPPTGDESSPQENSAVTGDSGDADKDQPSIASGCFQWGCLGVMVLAVLGFGTASIGGGMAFITLLQLSPLILFGFIAVGVFLAVRNSGKNK